MSGFRDIDGSLVMAGSPSLLGCKGTALRVLAGWYPHEPYPDQKSLRQVLDIQGLDEATLARVRRARELVLAAAQLLDPVSGR